MADAVFTEEQIAWLDARYRLNVPTLEQMVQDQASDPKADDDEADDA